MKLNELATESYQRAVGKGFYEDPAVNLYQVELTSIIYVQATDAHEAERIAIANRGEAFDFDAQATRVEDIDDVLDEHRETHAINGQTVTHRVSELLSKQEETK